MVNFVGHTTWEGLGPELEQHCDPSEIPDLKRAWNFAVTAHGAQRRPSGEPYVAHLSEAVQVLLYVGVTDARLLIAALLHDVVEDTSVELDEVKTEFGLKVAELVAWATKPRAPEGADKAEHKAAYLQRFNNAPVDAITVKLADRYSNVQRLENHPDVAKRFSYYQETVDNVFPLARIHPQFAELYQVWLEKNQHYANERTS